MAAGDDDTGGDATPDHGKDAAASDAAARALQDLLARLPQSRSPRDGGGADAPAIINPPLRANRDFNDGKPLNEARAPGEGKVTGDAKPASASKAAGTTKPAMARAAAAPVAGPTETVERPETPAAERPPVPVNEPEVEWRIRGKALPRRAPTISSGRMIWFLVSFLAPVVLGAAYLFLIMPDQYVTEFRFSVRVPVGNPANSAAAAGNAASSAFSGGNPTPGTDLLDNFMVVDYLRNGQAARDLNAKMNLRAMFSKPSDPAWKLGENVSQERLARYWKWMIYADYDVATGLSVVRIKGYTPQDSLAMAKALIDQSNQLVNDIGNQSQNDSLRFAKDQVKRANDTVADLQRRIATLSSQRGIDSPSVGVIQASTEVATTTRTNIAQIQSEIEVLQNQLHNPQAPQIVLLRQELAANQRALETAVGTANTATTNKFSDLTAQLQNALAVLSTAQAALSQTEASATSQRLYLTLYVRPALPESPISPARWTDLLILVLASTMIWITGMLIRNSILEHVS